MDSQSQGCHCTKEIGSILGSSHNEVRSLWKVMMAAFMDTPVLAFAFSFGAFFWAIRLSGLFSGDSLAGMLMVH